MDFTPPPDDDMTLEDDPGNVEDEADSQRRSTTSAVTLENRWGGRIPLSSGRVIE